MICENTECRKEIRKPPSKAKNKHHFCGSKCYGRFRTLFTPPLFVVCAVCGEKTRYRPARAKRLRRPYHCTTCFNKSKTMRGRVKATCDRCGKQINQKASRFTKHKNHFCGKKCEAVFRLKPVWFKDAKHKLATLRVARGRARKFGSANEWLNGFGEGIRRYKGRLRQYEDKHIHDSFRPAQVRTHDYFIRKRDPIMVRWFALGRESRPLMFEHIYAFEKALRLVVQTKQLPVRANPTLGRRT